MKQKRTTTNGRVPAAIATLLKQLIGRLRRVIIIRGACAVAGVCLALMLAAMALDASAVLISALSRWLLAAAVYIPTGAAVYAFLVRPLSRTFTMTGVARMIEVRRPELQERISSSVELLTSTDDPDIRGSDALIQALVEEAKDEIKGVRPKQEVSLRAARTTMLAAGAVALVFALILAVRPKDASRLALRVALPFLNLPNIHAEDLSVSPGDTLLCRGQRLEVSVRVKNPKANSAELTIRNADSTVSLHRMVRLEGATDEEQHFAFTSDPLDEGLRYRVRAGDALSRSHKVTVVPRPEIEFLDIVYRYPEYTGDKPLSVRTVKGDVRAVAGTTVSVTARISKEVASARLLIDGQASSLADVVLDAAEDGASICRFVIEITPKLSARWGLRVRDEHDFENEPSDHLLAAIPDARPVVEILTPEGRKMRMDPSARIPLVYQIVDDYGLSGVSLSLKADGKPLPERVLWETGAAQPERRVVERSRLRLRDYDLRGVKRLSFQVFARDMLPTELRGPQVGASSLYVIELDPSGDIPKVQQLQAEAARLWDGLQRTERQLEEVRRDVQAAKPSLSERGPLSPESLERLARVRNKLARAHAQAREVATAMDQGFYDGQDERLEKGTVEPIEKAARTLDDVGLTDEHEQRKGLVVEAEESVGEALSGLKALQSDFDGLTQALDTAIVAEDIAERQAELAASVSRPPEAASASASDTEEPEKQSAAREAWAQQQEEVASDMAGLVQGVPEARALALKDAKEEAKRSATTARDLTRNAGGLARGLNNLQKLEAARGQLDAIADKQAKLEDEIREKVPDPQLQALPAVAEAIEDGRYDDATGRLKQGEQALRRAAQRFRELQATEELATRLGKVAEKQAESDPTPEAVRELTNELGTLAALAQKALPMAKEAFEAHDPREALKRATKSSESPDAMRAAAEKTDRLSQVLRAAALAGVARNIAARQQALAKQAAELAREHEEALQEAGLAGQDVRAVQEQLARLQPVDERWKTALADRGRALGAQSQRLADGIAANPVTRQVPTRALSPGTQTGTQVKETSDRPEPAADTMEGARKAADETREVADLLAAAGAEAEREADRQVAAARRTVEQAKAQGGDRLKEARWGLESAEKERQERAHALAEARRLSEKAARLALARTALADDRQRLAQQVSAGAETKQEALADAEKEEDRHLRAARRTESSLEELARPQQRLAERTRRLEAGVRDALPSALDLDGDRGATQSMKQAVRALERRSAPDAARHTAEAAEKAEEIARALNEAAGLGAPSLRPEAPEAVASLQSPAVAEQAAPAEPEPGTPQPQAPSTDGEGAQGRQETAGSLDDSLAPPPTPTQEDVRRGTDGDAAAPPLPLRADADTARPDDPAEDEALSAARQPGDTERQALAREAQSLAERQREIAEDAAELRDAYEQAKKGTAEARSPTAEQRPPSTAEGPDAASAPPESTASPESPEDRARQQAEAGANALSGLKGLAPRQRALANTAGALRRRIRERLPRPQLPDGLARPGDLMQRAARAMDAQQPDEAVRRADEARAELAGLATRLASDGDPSLGSRLSQLAPRPPEDDALAADTVPSDQVRPAAEQESDTHTPPADVADQAAGEDEPSPEPATEPAEVLPEDFAAAAAAADELLAKQTALRNQARNLLTQQARQVNSEQLRQTRLLQRRQDALAKKMRGLADLVADNPELVPSVKEGTDHAAAAAEALGKRALDDALAAAHRAVEHIDGLARHMDTARQAGAGDTPTGEAAPDAAPHDDLAGQIKELGELESQLADEMAALRTGGPAAALATQAGHLAGGTADLADQAETVARQAQQLLKGEPAAQTAAGVAAGAVRSRAAAGKLAQTASGEPNSGARRAAQQEALARLQEASTLLSRLSSQIPAQPGDEDPPDPDLARALTDAFDTMHRAAGTPEQPELAAHAAEQMAGIAAKVTANAKALNLNPQGGKGGTKSAASREVKATDLKRLGIQASDWLRLPGELRDEVLQAAPEEGPVEYRPLIKRYFREVAERKRRLFSFGKEDE